jgi:outer membrane receptor protein involved in Fe transport
LLAPVGQAEVQGNLSAFDDRRDRGVDFTENHGRGLDASLRVVGKDWSATGYGQWRIFESQFASVGPGRETVAPALDQHDVPASGWGAKAVWKPRAGKVGLSLGADVRGVDGETNERFLFTGGVPQRERRAAAEALTYGLFADAEVKSGATTFGAGVRVDRWAISDASLFERNIGGAVITDAKFNDRDGHEWSVRGGVDHKVSERLVVRASAYRSWRLPTINELVRPFRVGPDATAANAALNPEVLQGVEAGIDWAPAEGARLSLTVFANRLDGAIANVTQGAGPGTFPGVGFVAAGGLYRRRENLDAIVSRGIEADGEWRSGPWSINGSLALTHARIRDNGPASLLDNERPAQVPAVQAGARGSWEDRGRLALLALRYIGKQDESEGDREPLPGAWVVDAVGRWPIKGRLSLDLRAENLFDSRIVTSILADGTRERGTPRTLWIGLRLN